MTVLLMEETLVPGENHRRKPPEKTTVIKNKELQMVSLSKTVSWQSAVNLIIKT